MKFSLFYFHFLYILSMQSKHDLRNTMKAILTQMSGQQIFDFSQHIIQQLLPLIDQYSVRSVFLPLSDEPQIQSFIQLLLDRGKLVVVPQIDGNILVPVVYTSDAQIKAWAHGVAEIQEPIPYTGKIDIILVPGQAFSSDGKRLGRGRGYYDTFLAQFPQTKKIWLCFPSQIVDDVPVTENDILVDEVIA